MSKQQTQSIALTGLVKGRVQGVFFRAETEVQARRLGIDGWVRNTTDGHVEVLIGGAEEAVNAMRAWLLEGPPRARVDSLELVECDRVPGTGFSIRY